MEFQQYSTEILQRKTALVVQTYQRLETKVANNENIKIIVITIISSKHRASEAPGKTRRDRSRYGCHYTRLLLVLHLFRFGWVN